VVDGDACFRVYLGPEIIEDAVFEVVEKFLLLRRGCVKRDAGFRQSGDLDA